MQEFLEIGQIVNTFGIKGMVKVKPFTDDITRFDNLEKVYVESNKTKKQYEIQPNPCILLRQPRFDHPPLWLLLRPRRKPRIPNHP